MRKPWRHVEDLLTKAVTIDPQVQRCLSATWDAQSLPATIMHKAIGFYTKAIETNPANE